jgi:hypothetical protein
MQYIILNIQTIAWEDGMFLKARYVSLDTLKIKCHQVAPICPQKGGVGDIK